jgi:hypothetical protein
LQGACRDNDLVGFDFNGLVAEIGKTLDTGHCAVFDQDTGDLGLVHKLGIVLVGITEPGVHGAVLDASFAAGVAKVAAVSLATRVLRDVGNGVS